MIDEKKLLAEELNKYIKLEKTQEECIGFIDGFEKALEVVKNCSIPVIIDSGIINKEVTFEGKEFRVYNVQLMLAPEEDGSFKHIWYDKLRK